MILTSNLDQYLNLRKETRQHQKNLTMTSYQQTVTSLLSFWFLANLKQSGSRSPAVQSVKLTFSLTVTFCFTVTENGTEESLTQLSY